jgi:orotate phosphoribosyltransferase
VHKDLPHDPAAFPEKVRNRPPDRAHAAGDRGGAFQRRDPFTLASGLPSPTYIDCRKLISYPRIRATLMDFLTVTVMRDAGFEAFDNIAGGETAGIPFAALVAERMALPMTYVRKKPKGYGRNARIEGVMREGERVLLVEDLTTDGGSKLSFVDAIRETGATCGHTAVIFYYGIFPETDQDAGRSWRWLHHLCTWWDVLARGARQRGLRRGHAGRGRGASCATRAPGRRRGPGAKFHPQENFGGTQRKILTRQGLKPHHVGRPADRLIHRIYSRYTSCPRLGAFVYVAPNRRSGAE